MWERASYFITAVAAVLGWLITHYIERVTQTPTVEYNIKERVEGGRLTATYQITNVNRTTAFGPITVAFIAPSSSPIVKKMRVRPREPASEGRGRVTTTPHSAKFEVPKLLPGARINFTLTVLGKDRPHLYLEPRDTVRFTPRNLETWLAKNEAEVVLALIGLWALVLTIVVWAAFYWRQDHSGAAADAGPRGTAKEET